MIVLYVWKTNTTAIGHSVRTLGEYRARARSGGGRGAVGVALAVGGGFVPSVPAVVGVAALGVAGGADEADGGGID